MNSPHFIVPRRLAVCLLALLGADCLSARETQLRALKQLSLEDLTQIQVTSLSRTEERWWRMPGAIDVISGEEIRRSGAQSLPDILRLGAGVHVAQSSERAWAIGVRGFNVLAGNKLSVMLDGRSLFTPFLSGVNWDAQDTMIEDIDRVEIARGPVGSLWGTYSVNGSIQIFTKPAWDTQGLLTTAASGTHDPLKIAARYGGRFGPNTFYRVYAKYFQADWSTDQAGRSLQDKTDFFQTGFRLDSLRERNATLTVQGDFYTNKGLPLHRLQTDIEGANVLGRWRQFLPNGNAIEFEGYVEHTSREIPFSFSEERQTAAGSIKYNGVSGAHQWLVGLDAMVSRDRIGDAFFISLTPSRETIYNVGLFIQDTYTVVPEVLRVTAGGKIEHNFYTGFEFSPTVRAAWTPQERTTLWAAVSRAVRAPVRLDRGLTARIGPTSFFEPNDAYDSESVISYELGWRHQFGASTALDFTVFHSDYDNVRSNEPVGAEPFPRTFKNTLYARSHGAELSLIYQPSARILLKAHYRYLDLTFGRKPGSQDVTGGDSEGNDPRHLFKLSAHFALPANWEFDVMARHVSKLPNPPTDAYTTFDLRLGWVPTDRWELSIVGNNLLEKTHRELVTTNSLNEWVPRTVTFQVKWRY